MKTRIAILISGRGSNMQAIIREAQEGILRDCCEPVIVVSNREDAPGLARARSMGVRAVALPSRGLGRSAYDRALIRLLEPYEIDYLVLAGFMRIVGPDLIARYPNRIVNIHPADPALFRGIGAYEWAWETRREWTTITVHLVDEGVDTGPILAQERVCLRGATSLEDVERRGLAVEHALYSRVLRALFLGERTSPEASTSLDSRSHAPNPSLDAPATDHGQGPRLGRPPTGTAERGTESSSPFASRPHERESWESTEPPSRPPSS